MTQHLSSTQNPAHSKPALPARDVSPAQKSEAAASRRYRREALVSWLFLLGSLLFVLDAALANWQGVSFSSLLHLAASILFTVGSLLLMPTAAG